jgi:hypothetical protein
MMPDMTATGPVIPKAANNAAKVVTEALPVANVALI